MASSKLRAANIARSAAAPFRLCHNLNIRHQADAFIASISPNVALELTRIAACGSMRDNYLRTRSRMDPRDVRHTGVFTEYSTNASDAVIVRFDRNRLTANLFMASLPLIEHYRKCLDRAGEVQAGRKLTMVQFREEVGRTCHGGRLMIVEPGRGEPVVVEILESFADQTFKRAMGEWRPKVEAR